MSYPTQLTALGLMLAFQVNTAAATESPGAFRIMSAEEVTAHSAAMNTLRGSAREDYRNAQYEQLRQRALEQGYGMPPAPPWQAAAMAQTPATPSAGIAAGDTAPAADGGQNAMTDTAARHAAMREKMRAHREALLQAANSKPADLVTLADPTPAPSAVTAPAEPAPVAAAPTSTRAPAPTPTLEPVAADTPPAAVTEAPVSAAPQAGFGAAPAVEMSAVAAPPTASLRITEQAPPPAVAAKPADTTLPGAAEAAEMAAAAPQGSDPAASSYASSDAMNAYREAMRNRFDDYMKERQAKVEEAARLQREQHEANMEKSRAARPAQNRFSPYPYPAAPPAYGPRYPSAYPGYRTPYWQQR